MSDFNSELMIGDDFPETVDDWDFRPQYQKDAVDPGVRTTFGEIAKGRTLGKRVVVNPRATNSQIDLLELSGSDSQASRVCLVLASPQVITGLVIPAGDFSASQNLSGEVDNDDASFTETQGNATAFIEWGIGGTSSKAKADFSNGLTVNLTTSFLRIRAQFAQLPAGLVNFVVLRSFVGPGNSGSNQAQFTETLGGLAVLASSTVRPVPNFAKTFSPAVVSVAGASDYMVTFFRDRIGGFPTARYFFNATAATSNPRVGEKIPIPNGSMFFQLQNLSAVDILANTNVIFDLSL